MNIDDLLAQIPTAQIAQALGVDEEEADRLVRGAVPALLGGMEANAQDPGGAASLQDALGQHVDDPVGDLGAVDTDDGQKIVNHVFGDQSEEVANRLGGAAGGSILSKLLPMIAPMVLSWLASRVLGGKGGQTSAGLDERDDADGGLLGGGGLGDILGQILGGGGGGASGGGSSGGSSIPSLEDLLGGGRKK